MSRQTGRTDDCEHSNKSLNRFVQAYRAYSKFWLKRFLPPSNI